MANLDGVQGGHHLPASPVAWRREAIGRVLANSPGPSLSMRRAIRLAGVMTLDFLAITGALLFLLPILSPPASASAMIFPLWTIALASGAAVATQYLFGLYRRSWRFVSFADCAIMGVAVAIGLLAGWSLIAFIEPVGFLTDKLPTLALLHFCLSFLAMQLMRMARRAFRKMRHVGFPRIARKTLAEGTSRVILCGRAEWAASIIDMTRVHPASPISICGILLPESDGPIVQLRGVPVLGVPSGLVTATALLEQRGMRPDGVVVCDDGINLSVRQVASLARQARDLQLKLTKVGDDWGQLIESSGAANDDTISTADLLGREELRFRDDSVVRQLAGETILVTGAGGTIGGELVWQLASFNPVKIVLLDHSEYNLYAIEKRIRDAFPQQKLAVALCNIRNSSEVRRVFDNHRPGIVYHAAALKHVPMVEANPCAGAHTNILGTKNIADAVCEFGTRAMVQVSTDKAVNPVGLMGATKRVGELYAQSLDLCGVDDPDAPRFMTVRFGNVLGSSGSVVPLFREQLLAGGPLTITHPEIERFFMTVSEAVQLILEGSTHALQEDTRRGRIFVLDMGTPVKIVDLANRMIRLYGLEPEVDIGIRFTGLRPGEKLYEELFDSCEAQIDSGIPGVFEAHSNSVPLPLITRAIELLAHEVAVGNEDAVRQITHNLITLPHHADVAANFVFDKNGGLKSTNLRMVEEA